MTEAEAKDRLIAVASAEVGYHEEGDNWTKYAAELDPLGITYGNKQGLAWCGEFVLWCAYKAFGRENGLELMCSTDPSGIPLCSAGAEYFKKAGRWYTSNPQRGDIIFFNYSGGINHTGIVEFVSGGLVHTIEGNSSEMVARRVYAIGYVGIAGYGRPRWSIVSDTPEDETPVEPDPQPAKVRGVPMLRKGDRGETVKALKALLILRGCTGGFKASNPNFGTNVEKAVIKFQTDNGLEVDGIVGDYTWSALLGVK